ncbi:MAG: H-X9-DG-CTERM domain-containing protein [Limisphaera sp.]
MKRLKRPPWAWGPGQAAATGCRGREGGFTRTELATVVLLLMVVGGVVWAAVQGTGEPRRTWGCRARLKTLGEAFQTYAMEREHALPVGAVRLGTVESAWDREIAKGMNPTAGDAGLDKLAQWFRCPSDAEPRGEGQARSYSMPMYELRDEGWPPRRLSMGGVGLYLDPDRLRAARESDATLGDSWPVMRVTMVPAPAETALLVERIAIRNVLGSPTFACILHPREQWAAKTLERPKFHGGKFNYLMVDGHVERMTERESGGHTGSGGVWTLRPDD